VLLRCISLEARQVDKEQVDAQTSVAEKLRRNIVPSVGATLLGVIDTATWEFIEKQDIGRVSGLLYSVFTPGSGKMVNDAYRSAALNPPTLVDFILMIVFNSGPLFVMVVFAISAFAKLYAAKAAKAAEAQARNQTAAKDASTGDKRAELYDRIAAAREESGTFFHAITAAMAASAKRSRWIMCVWIVVVLACVFGIAYNINWAVAIWRIYHAT
jgi:hypothetical protein